MNWQIEREVEFEDGAGGKFMVDVIVTQDWEEDTGAVLGQVQLKRGFVRCSGQYYVGQFGRETAIYGGDPNGIYYAPVSWFDGQWKLSQGQISPDSGTGQLFSGLEAFAVEVGGMRTA